MNLNFLGVGSAYNPTAKNTNAYVSIGDTLLLFDCGETAFEKLYTIGLLNQYNTFIIAITHFHSDHCGSLGSMISYCHCKLHKKVYVMYPNTDICEFLQFTGVEKSMFEYVEKVPKYLQHCLCIKPIKVQHDPMLQCFGYLIKLFTASFFYGGDSVSVPTEILELFKSGKIDTIYQDVTYENAAVSFSHGSLEQLCMDIPEDLRSKVVCMHFDHDFSDKIKACGFIPASAL